MAKDPYRYYRIEARELLDGLGRGMLELEKMPGERRLIKELLRLAHTLKGASRVVKQREVAELAHTIEDALAPFREGAAVPEREQFDQVFALLDRIGAKLSALEPQPADGEEASAAEEPFESVRVPVQDLDVLVKAVFATGVRAQGLRRPLAALAHAGELAAVIHDQLSSPRPSGAATPAGRRLVALTEELHVSLDRVRRELETALEHTDTELAQVRDGVDQLRLLSASGIFGALERATRDAAADTKRRVEFEASGGDVKLDAHVLAALRDAMLHVVRNAVAHGIEPAAERAARGKPPSGRVAVAFERRGQRVAFVCRDDGRGIDVSSIALEARRRGLVGEGDEVDADAAVALLMRGGLSTSRGITEVSGRGIGLDVVRETARRLKGDVAIRTEAGRGTTVELCVPVSLSSSRALFVEAAGALACLPLDAVGRTLQVAPDQIAASGQGEAIMVDGDVLAFAPLARILRRPAARTARPRPWPAVIVHAGDRAVALAVDRLAGIADVIVRRLPAAIRAEPFVAGAALDTEGTPQLVLDPTEIVEAVLGIERAPITETPVAPRMLVIDDSLTTRMLEQSILESAGYRVELASSGEEGLAKARASRFDLFLVDVEMPGMDGFEFIRLARADPSLERIPSILVTSRSSPEDRQRGAQVGARAYLVKNEFEQGVLLENIRDLVG